MGEHLPGICHRPIVPADRSVGDGDLVTLVLMTESCGALKKIAAIMNGYQQGFLPAGAEGLVTAIRSADTES